MRQLPERCESCKPQIATLETCVLADDTEKRDAWTAYEEDVHVPLIVRGPGVPAGRTLGHIALNNDLAPTFAAWASAKALLPVDGRSLAGVLREHPQTGPWRDAFLIEGSMSRVEDRPAYRAVRTKGSLYVEYEPEEKELYDLNADPHQLHNLAGTRSLGPLDSRLDALKDCAGDACREAESP